MSRYSLAAIVAFLLLPTAAAAYTINGAASTGWVPIPYAVSPDFADDQLTGADEADLVGDINDPALFTGFHDGGTPTISDDTLAFRLRFGSDENPAGFKHVGLVGLDLDLNQSVDLLIVVDNKGGSPEIAIRPVDGDGLTPDTTAIDTSGGMVYAQNASNYSWLAVSAIETGPPDLDLDGSNDYYLSFEIPFADLKAQVDALGIAGLVFDGLTQVAYVAGSSTNSNSVNQDWLGPDGATNWSQPWSASGGFSQPVVVPEPTTALLIAMGLGLLAHAGRRRA